MTIPGTPREIALQALLANSLVSIDLSVADALRQGTIDVNLADLGVDSLARLELSIFLGERFEEEVAEPEVSDIQTFSALVNYISIRIGAE